VETTDYYETNYNEISKTKLHKLGKFFGLPKSSVKKWPPANSSDCSSVCTRCHQDTANEPDLHDILRCSLYLGEAEDSLLKLRAWHFAQLQFSLTALTISTHIHGDSRGFDEFSVYDNLNIP